MAEALVAAGREIVGEKPRGLDGGLLVRRRGRIEGRQMRVPGGGERRARALPRQRRLSAAQSS